METGGGGADHAARQRWMSVLAKADWGELAPLFEARGDRPDYRYLRAPETGLVMLRGRMGGTGNPFNMGEATVTRCAVTTQAGIAGHAYVMGRNQAHAEAAAVLDAMLQDGATRDVVEHDVIAPLEKAAAERRQSDASRSAATKVEFFTMVRGED